MIYLILEPQNVIISASGFIPPNSIPLPQNLEGEEAEWLVVENDQISVDQALKDQILADREAAQLAQQQEQALRATLQNAVAFGSKLMEDFVMENISMGITADNMSEAVLDAMAPVEAALRTGTLHVAVKRLKAVPAEQKDVKYITDARLLAAVNKLEEYLQLPLSETLGE